MAYYLDYGTENPEISITVQHVLLLLVMQRYRTEMDGPCPWAVPLQGHKWKQIPFIPDRSLTR